MWVPTRALLQSLVKGMGDDTFTSTAKLRTARLALLNADFSPSVDLAWGDVSPSLANFDGYSPYAAITWTGAFIAENGLSVMESALYLFQPTGSSTPNTIFGHVLLGSDSVTLLAAEKYDDPIPLPDQNYAFTDVLVFGLDPTANYGLSIVVP